MAFDINGVIGTGTQFAASFLDGYPIPATFTVNPDGSYTLLAIGGPSLEDSNTGFPSVLAPNNLGLPGSPAFVSGDEPGFLLSVYTGPDPVEPDEITLAPDDYTGTADPEAESAGFVVAYDPSVGFLVQLLNGWDSGFGGGTPEPDYIFVSTSNALNTLSASGQAVPPAQTFPVTLQSVTYTFTCFTPGTRIATPSGFAAVDDLRVGDLVLTAAGAARPVVWHGVRMADCRRCPDPRTVWPVRIEAGAFGAAPLRPLLLSPDHSVFAEGVLIPIKRLINGTTVRQVPTDRVTYHHIELETHDVLLAEGLPAESFLDAGGKAAFEGAPAMQLHPDFAVQLWEAEACAPLCVVGPEVDRVRAGLADIARRAEQRAAA